MGMFPSWNTTSRSDVKLPSVMLVLELRQFATATKVVAENGTPWPIKQAWFPMMSLSCYTHVEVSRILHAQVEPDAHKSRELIPSASQSPPHAEERSFMTDTQMCSRTKRARLHPRDECPQVSHRACVTRLAFWSWKAQDHQLDVFILRFAALPAGIPGYQGNAPPFCTLLKMATDQKSYALGAAQSMRFTNQGGLWQPLKVPSYITWCHVAVGPSLSCSQ